MEEKGCSGCGFTTLKILFYFANFILLLSFTGCVKENILLTDPSDFNRPLNLAAPVFNAHFEAVDIIDRIGENDYIFIDEDSLITAVIDTTVSVSYDDVIEIKDFSCQKNYDINPNLKSAEFEFHFSDTIRSEIEAGRRIDSLIVSTGFLELRVQTPDNFTGTWMISFPDIINSDGNLLVFRGSFDGISESVIELDDTKFTFFQDKDSVSAVRMITDIDAEADGIPANTEFSVSIEVRDVVPYSVFGYFGNDTIKVTQDELTFDFFNDGNFSDMLTFKDIRLSLITGNSFGIPVAISLDTAIFSKESTGEELLLQIPNDNRILLSSARYDAVNDTVYPVSDSLCLDKDNSNIVDAVNMGPDKMYYYVSGIINPDGNTGMQNFIINAGNNDFTAQAKLLIPFWFKTERYERSDTIDFNFRDIVDDSTTIDYLDEMNLYFDFENGFPITIFSQAYVVDDNFNVIDSLFDSEQQIWNSPQIDENDRAVGTELTEVNIKLDHDKVRKFYDENATKIILASRLNTGDAEAPEFVKLYSGYVIDIHMSFDIKSSK